VCFVGTSNIEIWGMTPAERMMRIFNRHGIRDIIGEDDLASAVRPVILVRADAVIDVPLVAVLLAEPGLVLMGSELSVEKPVAIHAVAEHARASADVLIDGVERIPVYLRAKIKRPDELEAAYWKALRKRETPYALIVLPENLREVEWRSFMGTYKGATDFVTKHVWPRPAFYLTRLIAPTQITPNIVTAASAVLVFAALYLFYESHWYWGLLAAWLMTFLDTVDGKLARVTITSSKWGNVFDHGIDLIHPPFWYAAWAFGLAGTAHALEPDIVTWALGTIVVGYVVQRLMEGIAIKVLGLEIHIWRRIDTLFRQITARRNPNMVIFTASVLIGRPDLGLLGVAAWTLICLALHGVQLLQGLFARRKSGSLPSWMSEPRKSE
jgi:phosphatidylglycerophosphate synthase